MLADVMHSLQFEVFEEFLLSQRFEELCLFDLVAAGADGVDEAVIVLLVHQFSLQQLEHSHCHFEEGVVSFAEPQVPNFAKLNVNYATMRRLNALE